MIRGRWPPIESTLVTTQPLVVEDLPECEIVIGKPFKEAKIVAVIRRFVAWAFTVTHMRAPPGSTKFAEMIINLPEVMMLVDTKTFDLADEPAA